MIQKSADFAFLQIDAVLFASKDFDNHKIIQNVILNNIHDACVDRKSLLVTFIFTHM